jgi:hypothetical protein
MIHTTTRCHQQVPRPWRTTWRTTAPLHDCCHRAAQPAAVANLAVLARPMLHQLFNFLDHRPSPRKTEPDTKNQQPNTNPTQINLFKINSLESSVFSVLGVLGFTVLA